MPSRERADSFRTLSPRLVTAVFGRFSSWPFFGTTMVRHDGRHAANDLVCFGNECVSWADAFARGRGGWVASLPSMDTDINAICRIQGRLEHHGSSRAVIAPKGQQRCIPNLEFQLQPQLQPTSHECEPTQDNTTCNQVQRSARAAARLQ